MGNKNNTSFFASLKAKRLQKKVDNMRMKSTGSLVSRGRRAVRNVDENSRQAVILQHRLLSELLDENKDTEYGQKYDFASIHTVEEFKQKVPFSTYDDYSAYVDRMMEGENNLICARPPLHYALTTGSVGVPKYIPVSEKELEKYATYSVCMAFGVADEYYRNTTGRGVPVGLGLNAIEMKVKETKSGVEKGSISGTLMKSVKDIVPNLLSAPWEVIAPGQKMDMKYLKTRLALQNKDLAFMDSAFLSGLVDLMDYIRDNYQMLCDDIEKGIINEDVEVPQDIRMTLNLQLKPDKKRADELRYEFEDGFDTPIVPRIWPKMSWVGGIGTAGFSPYVKRMRYYCGKSIPFNNICYAASESFMAVARHMGDTSYVLLPDGGFYEFIPVNAEDETKTLNIDQLEIGEDYEIVITNLSGFYRYRIQDVVKVTGYYNETPVLKFIYRKNQLISIAGEKTNEESVRWAMENFTFQTRIVVNDYSIYADTNTDPGHYIVLIEPAEIVPKEQIPYCRDVVEKYLSQSNPIYGDMRRNGSLGKLEVVFLQQQTYQLYRDVMIMKGTSANQLKPVRVIDTPFKEHFFFDLKEPYDE